MKKNSQAILRKLPAVETILQDPDLQVHVSRFPRKIVINAIQQAIQHTRNHIIAPNTDEMTEDDISSSIKAKAKQTIETSMARHYRRVINAAGIILHTGLGRAVLAKDALDQIQEELNSYSLLQIDPETSKRTKRDGRIEWLLQQLTGAQAATVVNNNAAATSIVLNTFAKGREVIVSRGQLVEIGGSFRLPDVMAFSGAKLIEVGTTNKTHARDYENAITENTAAIMRIHPSNYKIQGFSSEVPLEEMAEIAHRNDLIMIDDVGAGVLMDFSPFGFDHEPTLAESVDKGADVITASADKLIGAAQGGIILGKSDMIEAIRKNQFARILRVGKLTLVVLEATLKLFLDESVAIAEIPTIQMLARSGDDIAKQAKRIASKLQKDAPKATVTTIDGFSQVGSGSLPAQNLATTLVAICPVQNAAESLAKQLRQYSTPIFARIQKEQVLIDPRTLRDGDEKILVTALLEILNKKTE